MPSGIRIDTVWTDERVAKLRKLCDQGWMSFSEIAAELGGGLSRNACIGKAARLGIGGRSKGRKPGSTMEVGGRTGIGATVQKINASRAKAERKSAFRAPPKMKAEPFVCAQVVDLEPLNIALEDLTESMCRFPSAESPFTFCGHLRDGSSYCPKHHLICSAGLPARRARANPSEFGKARGGVFGRVA